MKKLHELIEEQVTAVNRIIGSSALSTGEVWAVSTQVKNRFKTALKEIALQSIEATREHKEDETVIHNASGLDYFNRGKRAAREEAKQRAGVFLGEVISQDKTV